MIGLFKDLFSTAMSSPMTSEKEFDRVMKEVNEDEMDLCRLENTVREEFDALGADVVEIEKGVDSTLQKTGG